MRESREAVLESLARLQEQLLQAEQLVRDIRHERNLVVYELYDDLDYRKIEIARTLKIGHSAVRKILGEC